MKKDFYSWIMGVLICCACSNDVTLSPPVSSGKPIYFAGSESTTRAQMTTSADINSMAIFAYHTAGDFNAATATPNYMFNTPVNKVDGVWTYSPVLFWPTGSDSKLSFFAATPAPTADNGISVETTVTTAGYPTFKITPKNSPTEQIDFCAATIANATYEDPDGDGTPATETNKGKVRLPFSHAMSKISFKASYTTSAGYADNISSLWVESIDVIGVAASGKVQLAQDGTYTWSENTGTTTTYTLQQSKGELTDNLPEKAGISTEAVSTEAGILCLVPQTIPDGAQIRVIIRGKDINDKNIGYLFRTSLTGTWEAGKAYTYNFTINDMDTELTTEEVTDFSYSTNAAQTYTVVGNGIYKIEIWGNQGGSSITSGSLNGWGGKGGYTAGEIELTTGDVLNIYVGQYNFGSNYVTGWNGAGCSGGPWAACSPGAGSIDVRFKEMKGVYDFKLLDTATDSNPLIGLTGIEATDPRIIVGGGGGGNAGFTGGSYNRSGIGGYAGGLEGEGSRRWIKDGNPEYIPADQFSGKGGTQTQGGAGGNGGNTGSSPAGSAGAGSGTGKFFNKDITGSGGGGGGWWGGGAGFWQQDRGAAGGGGGSSHVNSMLFTKIVLQAGNETFKSPAGIDETGHTGGGLVRITRWPTPTP